jgi:hypothetical protein
MTTWKPAEEMYAIVGGPPSDWYNLRIVDEETQAEVGEVVEVNLLEGWLRRHVTDADGHKVIEGVNGGRQVACERLEGRFTLERLVED